MKLKRLTALGLMLVMLFTLTACGSKETAQEEESAAAGIAVQVQTVLPDTIYAENKVSGRIEADQTATVMITSVARCTAVYKQAGDRVEAGDKICTLDMGSALATYKAARAGYNAAVQQYQAVEKQVSMALDNVANTKALFEIGAASRLEVDQAELSYENAVASRGQLEAAVQNAKSGLEQLDSAMEYVDDDGNVLAPASGTLTTMNGVEGTYISNAMPLATVVSSAQMRVTASVSEALVPKLVTGGTADVYISSLDQTFPATIRSVDRAANMQTQLYTVVLELPADAEGLMSGMFADVTLHTDVSEHTIVVPTEAILTSNEMQYVFVVEDGVARQTEVTTGLIGSGVTEILAGLKEGQQLVTVGQAYLADGEPVRIVSGED
jgi:RND family efflux transporter MFP subunit